VRQVAEANDLRPTTNDESILHEEK
jgi:hypothetical protein